MFPSTSVDMFPITIGVETVALLSKLDVDEHIKIEIGEEELDEVEFSKKETDEEIKEYIYKKYG
ncbi:MAG: hypothetical protein E6852_07140 [Peptoniphilus harei]|nr:hypothetical protein [Peptoniphilus harei]